MSDIYWATWNDCNGVFDVYRTRQMAREAIGGPEDEFMSVVPVRVDVIEGDVALHHCHFDEDEREKRAPKSQEDAIAFGDNGGRMTAKKQTVLKNFSQLKQEQRT